MVLEKCKLKINDGRILEGSICGYIDTKEGKYVLFWHDRDAWGVFPIGRIIPTQLKLFE